MKRLLYLALSLALALPASAQQLGVRQYFKTPRKAVLVQENEQLRDRVDSLARLVDSLKSAAQSAVAPDTVITREAAASRTFTEAQTDSLLHLWYTSALDDDFEQPDFAAMESEHLDSDVPDSVIIKRLEDLNCFITLPFNQTVKDCIIRYTTRSKSAMSCVLGLGEYYFPIFEEALARYGLPLELKYLAVVESRLNPTATSRAGARGIWQFMYSAAREYGLTIDSFVDERLDVEKAADAAARFLRDAYKVYGDWPLAISSYNCGRGNVRKAIARAGGKTDYWSIYDYLPRETRGYVPHLVGTIYALAYHSDYGIEPAEVGMPAAVDTFSVARRLHFTQINELVGVPMEDLRNLNPQYLHDIVPGTADVPCTLNLPYKWTTAFIEAQQDTLYTHRYEELLGDAVLKETVGATDRTETAVIVHKVKSGEYLGLIANKYHVKVAQIKKWNNLRSDRLQIGQKLRIYR